jgi:hypothetical protein
VRSGFTTALALKYCSGVDEAGVKEAKKPNVSPFRSVFEEITVPRVPAFPPSPIRCTTINFPHGIISSPIHEKRMNGRIAAITVILIVFLNFIIVISFPT